MTSPHIIVLGGGPAGCGAAFELRRRGKATVTLVEQQGVVGGNAGSFLHDGIWLDFGSHRLHSACDPAILRDIQELLGDDLRHRVRHGRIRLRGKWLHFPIKATDLLLHLDKGFALGMARDMIRKALGPRRDEGDTFESVLEANLGPTMYRHFYLPYARKLWGREPSELSGIQARKRVTAGSFGKLVKRLIKPPGAGRFWYPREGYGQISRAYADAAVRAGAELRLGWGVEELGRPATPGGRWRVTVRRGDEREVLEADHVWSTIPVTAVARMMRPEPPAEVLEAARDIAFQSMVLVYLDLPIDQWTTTDAHYFPEANVSVTRVSEPKNYFGLGEPKGRTTICAEIPCTFGDRLWSMSDAELGELVAADLARCEIPVPAPTGVFTRKLRQAYPLYTMGYEHRLQRVDAWLDGLDGFLVYGRQGLFAHDNTHHALYMAYAAVDCLDGAAFDRSHWEEYRAIFATHVVED